MPVLKVSEERKLRDAVRTLSLELIRLQKVAFDADLIVTAHNLNKASKSLGWEAVRLLEGGR